MRAALEAGANVWNGGDFYGPPDANSLQLLHAYFTKYPDDASRVVIVMKSLFAVPNGPDCSAENVEKCVSNILNILDGKCFIDVLEPARIDPKVSVEDTMKYLLPFVQSGKIGGIGLSEAKAETIRRAAAITKISSLEIELSLFSTDPLSNGQAVACAELDIPIVAYSPLSRGFLSGQLRSYSDLAENDNRKRYPRYQPEVFDENLKLVHEVEKVAKREGATTPQVALACNNCGEGEGKYKSDQIGRTGPKGNRSSVEEHRNQRRQVSCHVPEIRGRVGSVASKAQC